MKTQATMEQMISASKARKAAVAVDAAATVDLMSTATPPTPPTAVRVPDASSATATPPPPPPTKHRLDPVQNGALNAAMTGANMLISGPAGCGKSLLIDSIVERMRAVGRRVVVTSTTGSSAQLIGGKTVYSYLSIGIGTSPVEDLVRNIRMRKQKPKYTDIDCLIIDEISMMSGELMEKIEEICRTIRYCRPQKPFGGLQMIIVGDFYQLPFIVGEMDRTFCFEHERFNEWFPKKVVLNTIYRLRSTATTAETAAETAAATTAETTAETTTTAADATNTWLTVLQEARNGSISEATYQCLEGRKMAKNSKAKFEYDRLIADNLQPTRIYPRKIQVETINQRELNALAAPKVTFEPVLAIQRSHGCVLTPSKIRSKLSGDLEKVKPVVCCVGAQVMVTKNFKDGVLVNGTRGVVMEITETGVVIRTKDGHLHSIERVSEPFDAAGGANRDPTWEATVSVMPLQLAWAVTIHKSQGMTLDLVECDLGHTIFECGQAYVALSRVRDLNSIFITNLSKNAFRTNEKVVAFYESIAN